MVRAPDSSIWCVYKEIYKMNGMNSGKPTVLYTMVILSQALYDLTRKVQRLGGSHSDVSNTPLASHTQTDNAVGDDIVHGVMKVTQT